MSCWEYKIVELTSQDGDLEKQFNELGVHGWELCTCTQRMRDQFGGIHLDCVFKRRMAED